MEQPDENLLADISINPSHLEEEELHHECKIRNVYFPGLVLAAHRAQLKHSFEQEREREEDVVDKYKEAVDSETLETDFNALITTIGKQSGSFFSAIAAPDFAAPTLLSRLKHYSLRLQRFPEDKYNSEASITTRKLFNDLSKIAIKVQQPRIDNNVVNELVDTLPNDRMNSTVLTNEAPTSSNVSREGVPMAQPAQNPYEIQTSESFRMSSQFNAFANHPTPPCARGYPLGVQFQTPPEQIPTYGQAHALSPHTDWSLRTQDVPHSARANTVTVPSTGTRPAPSTNRQQNNPNIGQANHNTIRITPSEYDALYTSASSNNTHRTLGETFSRQAGSELQALKRWLGAKTFEGEIVDNKHFSIDEFLSNLKLCVESGMCSEQTMIKNLAPAFSGRAFKWWTTTHGKIQTFNQLAQSLKVRFATYAGSVEGLMSAIYGRRQQRNETLPDFVDSMQQLMDQLPSQFNDQQRISTIISCASLEDAKLLRSRYYADITEFTRHVAFLSQDRPRHIHERNEKRSNREKPVFSCEVTREETGTSSEEEESAPFDIQAITAAFQKSLIGLKNQRPSKQMDNKNPKPPTESVNKNRENSTNGTEAKGQRPKFQCFGCNAPDVYYANCKNCQVKQAKEDIKSKREIYCFGCGAANVYFTNCTDCQAKLSKNASPASVTATSQAQAR